MFTHINFCKVNMNYMWNDIYTCYVEWYMPTMLSSSIDTFSGLSCAFWSGCTYQYTNYCNSIPKISLTVWKVKISAYLDIDTKIMHVFIYKISIISSYWHWNLLRTAITCTTISTLMKFCSYKWNKDLQQFSTEKWLDMSDEIYLPYSHMHYPLLLQ